MLANLNRLSQWLLQEDPDYRRVTWVFLRLLALVYLIAFVSTALEITGLVGEQGILPTGDLLQSRQQNLGGLAWLRHPTLFWLDSSDLMLLSVSYLGCIASLVLLFNRWQRPMLILLFVLYLSLFQVGQVFFAFQWEFLLLEAGFISIFLVSGANRLLVFLLHWLLFRLRFLSGVFKLYSGDATWADLSTLNYYFETQPLPHMGAWYAHQLPDWMLRAGTGATLFVELVVPFFIFLPRPFRLFACGATILIQVLIMATSNHNFVNLLTIALCLFLLDDRALRALWPWSGESAGPRVGAVRRGGWPQMLLAVVLIGNGVATASETLFGDRVRFGYLSPVNWVRAWGLGNVYHIFPVMQTERHELVIEGSHDGHDWHAYDFAFKPDSTMDAPRLAMPLHPRLDWMIWFVPPQHPRNAAWFNAFMQRLLENRPQVTALLRHNPFAEQAPHYLRIKVYRFRFSTPAQRAAGEPVWQTEYLGLFPNVEPRSP